MEPPLIDVAPSFVAMAHQIVWCSVASVDPTGRPWSRILHPIWEWDGEELVGWVATAPTPLKRSHLDSNPFVSLSYWSENHDTCQAECKARWAFDDETRTRVWDLFVNGPEPVGYDPTLIPAWTSPTVDAFAILRLEPWRLRVFPGTLLIKGEGQLLKWHSAD
jgi:hypothetical protein